MDLLELETSVASTIGIDITDSGEKALVDRWLNQGVVDVLKRTRCRMESAQMNLAVDPEGNYRLDKAVLLIDSIWIDRAKGDLERVSPRDIDEYRRFQGAPYTMRYALAGSDLLMIYPNIEQTTTFNLRVVPKPQNKLVNPTDDPSSDLCGGVPEDLHELIELYAFAKAADYREKATSAQGQSYRQMYLDGCREAVKEMTRKGGPLAPAVFGRRVSTAISPSAYPRIPRY